MVDELKAVETFVLASIVVAMSVQGRRPLRLAVGEQSSPRPSDLALFRGSQSHNKNK